MKKRKRRGSFITSPWVGMERQPMLVAVSGDTPGRRMELAGRMTLGRGSEVDILVDTEKVSREHARFETAEDGRLTVEDLGSRNGTFVNGRRIQGKTELADGDMVSPAGSWTYVVTHHEPVEDEWRRNQRLEIVEQLSGGVVHDLNNMIGVIISALDHIDSSRAKPEELEECLADIRSAARRSSELTPRLLAMLGDAQDTATPIALEELCADVVRLVSRTFDKSIAVRTHCESGVELVGNEVQLHQVLMNLCINARDAMPHGGTLYVTARRIGAEEHGPLELAAEGSFTEISVADTGVGISEGKLDAIFQPFFTTKGKGGTGLGLSTVRRIVGYHGGRMKVRSVPGKGSTFCIYLPCTRSQSAPPVTARRRLTPLAVPRRVLIVDDERFVRRSYARLIRALGAEVVEAENGAEALARIRRDEPDVVILDMNMPILGGEDCLLEIRRTRPQLPVIVVTGDVSRDKAPEANALLRKPVTRDTLLQALADVRQPPRRDMNTLDGVRVPVMPEDVVG